MTEDPSRDEPELATRTAECLVVGLGASAGGLEALEAFFRPLPEDTGMAFVVVTHMHPGRTSYMPEILQRHCRLPVHEVTGPMTIVPNHVYLSAPGGTLAMDGRRLHPVELADRPTKGLPIDQFFRSLAGAAKQCAIGVVLSGTGSDGTLGLKEIKGASGMTMAQEEATARYAGMPHSAIASLQVDYVLPPEAMPAQLLAYAKGALRRLREGVEMKIEEDDADALARIFVMLRTRTGHDFTYYKSTTIRRRVDRRMNVNQIDTLADYVRFLQANPGEVDQLFKELLIGVTSFFRDPDAFDSLAKTIIPDLLANKPNDYVLRVWVTGCSTGEEAYSLAILFREAIERTKARISVQIFATDLDEEAIDCARNGVYPESIVGDVSVQRLQHFFDKEEGTYRIKKEIREMLVFAQQNVIEDPPFTKIDLLSCRNLLIYLEGKLQQRLIPMFHYALKPGGFLFLGTSESIGNFGHLFEPLDKKWKVFRRRGGAATTFVGDLSLPQAVERDAPPAQLPRKGPDATLVQSAERALLANLVPPAVIIHERGDIVHIHGRTGQFLEPAQGPPTHSNIYNMLREGLQLDVAVAIRQATKTGEEVIQHGVRVRTNGAWVTVDLRVRKLSYPEALNGSFLISFEGAMPLAPEEDGKAPPLEGSASGSPERLAQLERELQYAKEVHQGTVEELETTNEELKSTNEELQSTNEELQSANEELETSKEEMQSLNEELMTVNAELQGKVEELSRINDDMKNLLNGTDIATIFLDHRLNIKRYTEQAKRVIRLIPSDVGRPIGDLVSKLRYHRLAEDAEEVMQTLVFKEAEVKSEDHVYLMRILPYRTTDNVIDGLVVTFVDITTVKGLQEETRRMWGALQGSPTSVFGQDMELSYRWLSGTLFGPAAAEWVGKTDRDLMAAEDAEKLIVLKRSVLERDEAVRQRVRLSIGGKPSMYDVYVKPWKSATGELLGVSGVVTQVEDAAS